LAEANPKSLDEMLSADPLLLSDTELDLLIEHFRSLRIRFLEAEKESKAAGKKRVSLPKTETAALTGQIGLDDLL
jgi:hypothetical protein